MPLWSGVIDYLARQIKQGDRVRFDDIEVAPGFPDNDVKALNWIPRESKVTKLEESV